MEHFGISYDAINTHLYRLKKQEVITQLGRGYWVLTDPSFELIAFGLAHFMNLSMSFITLPNPSSLSF